MNASGEVPIDGKTVDITASGHAKLIDTVARVWQGVKESSIGLYVRFCDDHPDLTGDASLIDPQIFGAARGMLCGD